jgi:uncharacterized protein with von Willebrand factor type A (vWA) domain
MPEMAMSIQASSGSFILETDSNAFLNESLRNAQINNGVADFMLTENDLVVEETQFKSQMSVLMIDISQYDICMAKKLHLPKKVAMALAGINHALPKRYA